MGLGRHVGLAVLAGIIAGGVVGGLGGRIAMRVTGFVSGQAILGVSTSNGNRVGDITVGGTIGVLLVGALLGVLGGVLYAPVEPWFRRFRPWQGVAFGVFLLAAAGIAVLDPANSDFPRFGSAALNVAMFGALFLLFGPAIAWVFDRLPGVLPERGVPALFVVGLGWLALALTAVLVYLAAGGLGTNPEAPLTIIVAAALSIATAVRWRKFPLQLGYAALAVPPLAGAARLASALPVLLDGL